MVIACCIKARQGIFYRGNISRGNQKERLPRHRTKDEFESTKQWVYPPWMWGLRGYGRKTPSTFDSNSSFSYYNHCRYHSYISCHCCHELACDDRRQNESSAESSQVKHCTRFASLNRFNCRGPCTALIRRFDENNLTWWNLKCVVRFASFNKSLVQRWRLCLFDPHGFDQWGVVPRHETPVRALDPRHRLEFTCCLSLGVATFHNSSHSTCR